jgi:ubiquinone biosynthesis protein COQ4
MCTGDMIAVLGETTGEPALAAMLKQLYSSEEGLAILADRPLITPELHSSTILYPVSSLGAAYTSFMSGHEYSADERTPVRFVTDSDHAYVMTRYRQTHDIWHVVCDLPPTVLGELALKCLEMLQTGLPMTAIATLFGPLRLTSKEREQLINIYLPWAWRQHQSLTQPFITVYWERYFNDDLATIRQRLNIVPAPSVMTTTSTTTTTTTTTRAATTPSPHSTSSASTPL